MKKYFRAIICVVYSFIKFNIIRIIHLREFKFPPLNIISPFTEIEIGKRGLLSIGKRVRIRSGVKLRVRKYAQLTIGNNTFINHRCMITAHQSIKIGSNVQIGPNVLIYDHDHDYKSKNSKLYKSSEVDIGDNVWIAANVVILRGTKIGNDCVVGAGAILRGNYPDNTTIVQKRELTTYLHE